MCSSRNSGQSVVLSPTLPTPRWACIELDRRRLLFVRRRFIPERIFQLQKEVDRRRLLIVRRRFIPVSLSFLFFNQRRFLMVDVVRCRFTPVNFGEFLLDPAPVRPGSSLVFAPHPAPVLRRTWCFLLLRADPAPVISGPAPVQVCSLLLASFYLHFFSIKFLQWSSATIA